MGLIYKSTAFYFKFTHVLAIYIWEHFKSKSDMLKTLL